MQTLQSYRDSLAIAEKLAAADPRNTGWQRDLIVSHVKLAEVADATGNAGPRRSPLMAVPRPSQRHWPSPAGWPRRRLDAGRAAAPDRGAGEREVGLIS
ncbi:MAG: hypothetical protein U1E14_03240 [Geminicoccaceae bacterium]